VADLGCPQAPATVIWAAYQPFEGGAMLWRSDINRVTVFFTDATQETLSDQWHEEPFGIGAPPAGKVAPVRGFGWLWANHPDMAARLGWGLQVEKGCCLQTQYLVRGFLCRSVRGDCGSQYNRANEADFIQFAFKVSDAGTWSRL
jgi:hypothetical protein